VVQGHREGAVQSVAQATVPPPTMCSTPQRQPGVPHASTAATGSLSQTHPSWGRTQPDRWRSGRSRFRSASASRLRTHQITARLPGRWRTPPRKTRGAAVPGCSTSSVEEAGTAVTGGRATAPGPHKRTHVELYLRDLEVLPPGWPSRLMLLVLRVNAVVATRTEPRRVAGAFFYRAHRAGVWRGGEG